MDTPWRNHALLLDGVLYQPAAARAPSHTADQPEHLAELWSFLAQWYASSSTVLGQTSGSTGSPKAIPLDKRRMMASARLTCSFLGLQAGDSALLCMPLRYVGAKMVVVRALVAGLNLLCTAPARRPLRESAIPCFAAMTPMQVSATLAYPEDAQRLRQIRHLIIGGSAVDPELAAQLHDFPHAVWSTYGMTETLSHIALRRLNGAEASPWYTPFSGIQLSLSAEETLVIDAPSLCAERLVTNDLVTFNAQGQFRILGRRDNVINSGGVKVQIEEAEALLRPHVSQAFFITAVPDAQTGEQVVLLVEQTPPTDLLDVCKAVLPRYWAPRRILQVAALPFTGSDKPNREQAKALARRCVDLA